MDNPITVIDLKDLSKPVTVLIEKISDAVGVIYEPTRITNKAKAEAKADEIKSIAKFKTTKMQIRAIKRFFYEEGIKQENLEKIILNSFSLVRSDAKPQNLSKDWLLNFFDKSKLISDEEVQKIWSGILAGEANSPGRYSKRTINLLGSFDKQDIYYFYNLCNFNFFMNINTPLVFDDRNEIYTKNGINFSILTHLDSIGLISFGGVAGFVREYEFQDLKVSYMNYKFNLHFPNPKFSLNIGKVLLTNAGLELFNLCTINEIPGFKDYVINSWKNSGVTVV